MTINYCDNIREILLLIIAIVQWKNLDIVNERLK